MQCQIMLCDPLLYSKIHISQLIYNVIRLGFCILYIICSIKVKIDTWGGHGFFFVGLICLNVVTFKQRTMPWAWCQLTKLSKFLIECANKCFSVNDQTMIVKNLKWHWGSFVYSSLKAPESFDCLVPFVPTHNRNYYIYSKSIMRMNQLFQHHRWVNLVTLVKKMIMRWQRTRTYFHPLCMHIFVKLIVII